MNDLILVSSYLCRGVLVSWGLIHNDGFGAVSVVMQVLYRTVVVKTDLSVYIPTLSYGHELRIATEKTRSWIQAAGMTFLW